jgi:hypothetical protein
VTAPKPNPEALQLLATTCPRCGETQRLGWTYQAARPALAPRLFGLLHGAPAHRATWHVDCLACALRFVLPAEPCA